MDDKVAIFESRYDNEIDWIWIPSPRNYMREIPWNVVEEVSIKFKNAKLRLNIRRRFVTEDEAYEIEEAWYNMEYLS